MKKNKEPAKKKPGLPGYPHYPPSEDILNNNAEKVELDTDQLSRNPDSLAINTAKQTGQPEEKKRRKYKSKSESDVDKNDLMALGDKNLGMDIDDEDAVLRSRIYPVDMAASDLDIPGSELDDENESIGEEDEENNFYSLGGDEHD